MADARRDQNYVTTLIGVSSSDGTTPTAVYVDPTTHRLLVDVPVLSGAGAPASTPLALGRIYIDTSGTKVYVATGTSSSGDWTVLN